LFSDLIPKGQFFAGLLSRQLGVNNHLKEMRMRTFTFQLIALLIVLCSAFFAAPMQAAENYSELMNKAGMQRMLSQRIAKAYLYQGQGIAKQEATHQLKIALTLFEYHHADLKKVKNDALQELLATVQSSFTKYKELTAKPYSKENAAAVLETSEALLGACQHVVLKLEELSGAKIDSIINTSGRQRMLSQRIAKYYIAYQGGVQNEDAVQQLGAATTEFDAALKLLRAEKRNNERINMLLDKMKKLWGVIEPYVLKVSDKGNPSIVLTTTDDLTNLADEVTALYVDVSAVSAAEATKAEQQR
jgi:hypothetical protein